MVDPIDMKQKGGALAAYWVNYVALTFDFTHDLDHGFFKVEFPNTCISGIVTWLMWNEKKANQVDTGQITLFFRNGRVDWHGTFRKGCESIIHDHDCDL